MKARWRALEAKFGALQKREKQILVVATVLAIVMGGQALWVDPALTRIAALKKQIAKNRNEAQTLQAQIVVLAAQVKDPDASNKAALAEVKSKTAETERALRAYDHALVPADKAAKLLQALMARHRGLELVSLQTMPPVPLLAPPKAEAKPETKPGAKVAESKTPAVPGANIHKHGIEIKMAGNYLDLLAYVADLEQLPQKLLWGNMALAVVAYPRTELTLTVYTLSLDSIWLVV
ncbi:MAG: hypothetical protein HZC24_09585 [Rhodocyclales bacterium]|nr:hypothetical protein [Rhodocyclales bacterium]